MQKRLVRKLDLEIALSRIGPHPSPEAKLEQYTITPKLAADLLYTAAYSYDDIEGREVADLGCGTGTLAIGSALLGAELAVGVDIDRAVVRIASRNAKELGVKGKTQWIASKIDVLRGDFDTVLQNPPFGVQRRTADRQFLEKALEIGKRVYSLHMSTQRSNRFSRAPKKKTSQLSQVPPSPFLEKFIQSCGGEVKVVYTMLMTIPWMFGFHRKRKHEFTVDLYVVERKPMHAMPSSPSLEE